MSATYTITFHGDLEDCFAPHGYVSLDAALEDLAREWGWLQPKPRRDKFGCQHWVEPWTPDLEDDRVVVWRHEPGQQSVAVWHFSGWHWSYDADDLPGGPLDQGCLPALGKAEAKSLYSLAMEDY